MSLREVKKNDRLMEEATFVARDYMDFNQGGGPVKAIDNAVPYLGVTIQGTRGLWRAFKPGSGSALQSTYKLSQFAGLVVGMYVANQAMNPKTMAALKGNVDTTNNLIIPLGDWSEFQDEYGQTRYQYLKIPLDQGQRFFKVFFEASTDKWLGNEVDVGRVVNALKEQSPADVSSLPPTISGALGYVANKDFWRMEDVWKGTTQPFDYQLPKWYTGKEFGGSEEESIPGKTPKFFEDLGAATGLSPERTRHLVSELVTNGTVWSTLANQGYNYATGDVPDRMRKQHLAQVLTKFPVVKGFYGVTNPYSKHSDKMHKVDQKYTIESFKQNQGMDLVADQYLYDGTKTGADVVKYARSFRDFKVEERLMDRFYWEQAIKTLPEKSFWRRIKGIPSLEAKAEIIADRMRSASEAEKAQLFREMGIIEAAGKVMSSELQDEIIRQLESPNKDN